MAEDGRQTSEPDEGLESDLPDQEVHTTDDPQEREPQPSKSEPEPDPEPEVDIPEEEWTPESALETLRSDWRFSSIVQFCRMFQAPLKLKNFSGDFLEKALLNPTDYQGFLSELCYKLLRPDASQPYQENDCDNWERLLAAKLAQSWREFFPRNPLSKRGFYEISPMQRVQLVYALCEWRIHECPVLRETVRWTVENAEYTAEALRHYPIGEDSKGHRYYYFSTNNEDCRLYREEPPRVPKKARTFEDFEQVEQTPAGWFTECTTLEEMQEFAQRMGISRNKNERQLHELLTEQILPKLVATVEARRKAEEKAALYEAMPKKRSGRVQELAERKQREEEEKKKRDDEARRIAEERAKEKEKRRKEREREQKQLEMEEQRRRFLGLPPKPPPGPSREERLQARAARVGVQSAEVTTGDENDERPAKRRREEHSPGWSPLGEYVIKGTRTSRYRPQPDLEMLKACSAGKMPDLARHTNHQSQLQKERAARQVEAERRRLAMAASGRPPLPHGSIVPGALANLKGASGMHGMTLLQRQQMMMQQSRQPQHGLQQHPMMHGMDHRQDHTQHQRRPSLPDQSRQPSGSRHSNTLGSAIHSLAATQGAPSASQQQQQTPQQAAMQQQRAQLQQVLQALTPSQQQTLMQLPVAQRNQLLLQLLQQHTTRQKLAQQQQQQGQGMQGLHGLHQSPGEPNKLSLSAPPSAQPPQQRANSNISATTSAMGLGSLNLSKQSMGHGLVEPGGGGGGMGSNAKPGFGGNGQLSASPQLNSSGTAMMNGMNGSHGNMGSMGGHGVYGSGSGAGTGGGLGMGGGMGMSAGGGMMGGGLMQQGKGMHGLQQQGQGMHGLQGLPSHGQGMQGLQSGGQGLHGVQHQAQGLHNLHSLQQQQQQQQQSMANMQGMQGVQQANMQRGMMSNVGGHAGLNSQGLMGMAGMNGQMAPMGYGGVLNLRQGAQPSNNDMNPGMMQNPYRQGGLGMMGGGGMQNGGYGGAGMTGAGAMSQAMLMQQLQGPRQMS